MHTLTLTHLPTALGTLLAELRELPHGLATPVAAGLLVVDTLRALGHADAAIALVTGIDPGAREGATVAVRP
jgi:hypothetical protein